jgi:hypothetical protein
VDLSAAGGLFSVEWLNPADGGTTPGETASGGEKRTFKPPFKGDAVLFIHRNP